MLKALGHALQDSFLHLSLWRMSLRPNVGSGEYDCGDADQEHTNVMQSPTYSVCFWFHKINRCSLAAQRSAETRRASDVDREAELPAQTGVVSSVLLAFCFMVVCA
jgi:hypothetical protein